MNGDTAVIITSSRSGSRFQSSTSDFSESFDHLVSNHHGEEFEAQLTVDPSALRQTIFGFGGAFTDAAGENLQRLSAPARRNLLESYYGKTGRRNVCVVVRGLLDRTQLIFLIVCNNNGLIKRADSFFKNDFENFHFLFLKKCVS